GMRRRDDARLRSAPRSGARSPRGFPKVWSCSCLVERATLPGHSSGIPDVVEAVLVEPEVMGELVENGDPDLLLEVGGVGERLHERHAEDADPVGEGARPVAALGERHALVEPEEVGLVGMLVLDRDLDVPNRLPELPRQGRQGTLDVLLEPHQTGARETGAVGLRLATRSTVANP